MQTKHKVTDELLQILSTVAALKRQNIEHTAQLRANAEPENRERYDTERAREKAEEAANEYSYATNIAEKHPDTKIEIETGSYFELACFIQMGGCVNAIDCYPDNKPLFFDQVRRFFRLKKWLTESDDRWESFSNRFLSQQSQRAYVNR